MVGCWVQDADGAVQVRLAERVSVEARRSLDVEAARLSGWLDGARVATSVRSPAMRSGRR